MLRLNPLWVSSLQLPRETSGAIGGLPVADTALVFRNTSLFKRVIRRGPWLEHQRKDGDGIFLADAHFWAEGE